MIGMLWNYLRECWLLIHLREYQPRMHLMPSIFGPTHYLVILRVYQNTNPHMSSKLRKSDSSSDNMKKLRNVKNYSTNSSTLDFRQFSRLVKHTPKCDRDRTNPCTVLNPQ